MLGRRASQHTVSVILRLRRSAEGNARQGLDTARTQLCVAQLGAARAAASLQQMENAIIAARARERLGPMKAGDIREQQAHLSRLMEERERRRVALGRSIQLVSDLSERVERLQVLLHLAIGRREAAERHRMIKRRERARRWARTEEPGMVARG